MVHSNPKRTYVMGYWPIPGNAKRSLHHYTKFLTLSLEMLAGQNLYFFSGNNSVLSSVEALCRNNGINLHVQRMLLDELPKRRQMDVLLMRSRNFGAGLKAPPADLQRDKGLIHYWRDLRQSGEDSFKKIFAVWHSKIDLLHMAMMDNPFSSIEFAWVDASIARFNNQRAGWDFRQLTAAPGVISHYPNDMRKNGRQLVLNASFLLGDRDAIERLHKEFGTAFLRALEENYPNDEETVLDGIVSGSPKLFSVITTGQVPRVHLPSGAAMAAPGTSGKAGGAPLRKVLVVGTFRSGTNAMQTCLETYFDVEVTFNEWFWKHGVPPTNIQCPVPADVPIVVMVKSPYAFHESLYPFWQYRRPNLDSGSDVSAFARKELIVFDVSGGNMGRPKYWYRCPTDYWNQFYYSWLSWTEVRSRCIFVRSEDVSAATEPEMLKIAQAFGLKRRNFEPITLPRERVGPEVPTERKGERFVLNEVDKQWIRDRVNMLVVKTFGYAL